MDFGPWILDLGLFLSSAAFPLGPAVPVGLVGGRRGEGDAHARGLAAASGLTLRRPTRRLRARSGGGMAFVEELLGRPLDRDLAADQLLDRVQREDIVVTRQRNGGSFRAGASRPADAVHVVL